VSWLKPLRTNGQLTSYGVYWRVLKAGQERDLMKRHIPPLNTHYEVHDLHKGEAYEFWVTASTQVGEGQSTPVVYATINNRGTLNIISCFLHVQFPVTVCHISIGQCFHSASGKYSLFLT
jgi:hypothetical protein